MVKIEAEKDGFKLPIQEKVPFSKVIEGVKAGKSPMKSMIDAVRPTIAQMWSEDDAKIFDKLAC